MSKLTGLHEKIAKHGVQNVELRYTSVAGELTSASVPVERLDAAALLEGIRLEPGALLVPDPDTAYLDPLRATPTLVVTGDLIDVAGEDPRRLAKRAEARLTASGVADTAELACDLRYYVFDALDYENAPDSAGYSLEATAPSELADLRGEVLSTLKACGVEVDVQRGGAAQQTTLELRPRALIQAADAIVSAKYIVKSVAERRGKVATFMPKPLASGPGSGLGIRLGLLKDGRSIFHDKSGWHEASQAALFAIGGMLAHAGSLLALSAPSANSYTRLLAEPEPLVVAFGASHPGTLVAINAPPRGEAKSARIEFRAADASANPYLAFAALLCACLDGIAHRIDPISAGFGPLEPGALRAPSPAAQRALATTLGAALAALETDHAYLTEAAVFDERFLSNWSAARRASESAALRGRPHPYEFELSARC